MMRPWQTSRKSSLRVECKEKELVALATLPVGPDDDDVRLGGSQCSLCAVSQAKMFAVALPGWDQPVDVCPGCAAAWIVQQEVGDTQGRQRFQQAATHHCFGA